MKIILNSKTAQLRQALREDEILLLPGAYDALTAKIIQDCGFKALIMGGYSIAASRLAQPDVGYLSMTEMLSSLKLIVDAIHIPVIADGDTGYGNSLSVRRTVQEYEKAGAAAIILEDQVWPKRCGHMQGKNVIPSGEHIQKIRAATEARMDNDLMILARTDARSVFGLDEAINRGKMYLDAGADALFIEAPLDISELEKIGRAFPDTILVANMVEGGKTPCLTARELQELGFRMVFWPCTALYTVVKVLKDVFCALLTSGSTISNRDAMLNFEQFNKFIGLEKYMQLEARYKE